MLNSARSMAKALYTALAVIYVFACQAAWQAVQVVLAPAAWLARTTRLTVLAERLPVVTLIGTIVPVALAAVVWDQMSGWQWQSRLGMAFLWTLGLHLCATAYTAAAQIPTDPAHYGKVIASRWPDRWYAKHLKTASNALYVRTLIVNSWLRIPAVIALIVPEQINVLSVVLFMATELRSGMPHEVLDHSDIHNNLFSGRHLSAGWPRRVLWLTSRYLRLILNMAYLRSPHFYRVQHVYVHHVENNKPSDTQSTLHRDRTSFLDFSEHALKYALSWSFACDVFAYLHRRGSFRECRLLVTGMAIWFSALVILACWSPTAAVFLLWVRFAGGPGSAMESYFQHGLVDPSAPEDVYRSTVNWIVDTPTYAAAGDFLHVRHHLRSGEHFSRGLKMTDSDEQDWASQGAICLGNGVDSAKLLRTLLTRDFDAMARYVVCRGQHLMAPDELREFLEARTKAIAIVQRSNLARKFESRLGSLFVALFLPKPATPPSAAV